ncbi:MAG: TetR family transcriptional regulator [Chloroflexota bacterium]|nr:MAG: TetR family transcriptional regulator [Chloroflexota bacterium]
MRRTKEEAEVTKQNILAAGLEVFSRKGYTATRVEDIARQANVTTGAIYHHFGGKSDLYLALVEQGEARANKLAQQIVQEGGTPATILRRLLVRLFQFLEEDEEYRAVVELFMNKTEMVPELATIGEQSLQGRRLMAHSFAQLIRQGVEAGEFRPSVSPEDGGLALTGFVNGMGLIWIQDQAHFSISERAENLVDLFLAGMTETSQGSR